MEIGQHKYPSNSSTGIERASMQKKCAPSRRVAGKERRKGSDSNIGLSAAEPCSAAIRPPNRAGNRPAWGPAFLDLRSFVTGFQPYHLLLTVPVPDTKGVELLLPRVIAVVLTICT